MKIFLSFVSLLGFSEKIVKLAPENLVRVKKGLL
jgi:hypothetical protein